MKKILIAFMAFMMVFALVSCDEAKPEDAVYKVGDVGPAGGWIFYDKGEKTDGWRYLEAAPEDLPGAYAWGASGNYGTEQGVGTGKSNTEKLPDSAVAAKACKDYTLNGFSDWFLPSKDELNLMRTNLFLNGKGSFSTDGDYYWSSSEFDNYTAWDYCIKDGDKYGENRTYAGDFVRPARAF